MGRGGRAGRLSRPGNGVSFYSMFSSGFRWNIRWKTAKFHLMFHVNELKKVEEKVEAFSTEHGRYEKRVVNRGIELRVQTSYVKRNFVNIISVEDVKFRTQSGA